MSNFPEVDNILHNFRRLGYTPDQIASIITGVTGNPELAHIMVYESSIGDRGPATNSDGTPNYVDETTRNNIGNRFEKHHTDQSMYYSRGDIAKLTAILNDAQKAENMVKETGYTERRARVMENYGQIGKIVESVAPGKDPRAGLTRGEITTITNRIGQGSTYKGTEQSLKQAAEIRDAASHLAPLSIGVQQGFFSDPTYHADQRAKGNQTKRVMRGIGLSTTDAPEKHIKKNADNIVGFKAIVNAIGHYDVSTQMANILKINPFGDAKRVTSKPRDAYKQKLPAIARKMLSSGRNARRANVEDLFFSLHGPQVTKSPNFKVAVKKKYTLPTPKETLTDPSVKLAADDTVRQIRIRQALSGIEAPKGNYLRDLAASVHAPVPVTGNPQVIVNRKPQPVQKKPSLVNRLKSGIKEYGADIAIGGGIVGLGTVIATQVLPKVVEAWAYSMPHFMNSGGKVPGYKDGKQVRRPALADELFDPKNIIVSPTFSWGPEPELHNQFSPRFAKYLKKAVPGVLGDINEGYKNMAISPYHQTLVVPADHVEPWLDQYGNPIPRKNMHLACYSPDVSDALGMNVFGFNEEMITNMAWDSPLRFSGLENWQSIAFSNLVKPSLKHEAAHAFVTGPLTDALPADMFKSLYKDPADTTNGAFATVNEEILAESAYRFWNGSYDKIIQQVRGGHDYNKVFTHITDDNKGDWKAIIKAIRQRSKTPWTVGSASEYLQKYPTLIGKPRYEDGGYVQRKIQELFFGKGKRKSVAPAEPMPKVSIVGKSVKAAKNFLNHKNFVMKALQPFYRDMPQFVGHDTSVNFGTSYDMVGGIVAGKYNDASGITLYTKGLKEIARRDNRPWKEVAAETLRHEWLHSNKRMVATIQGAMLLGQIPLTLPITQQLSNRKILEDPMKWASEYNSVFGGGWDKDFQKHVLNNLKYLKTRDQFAEVGKVSDDEIKQVIHATRAWRNAFGLRDGGYTTKSGHMIDHTRFNPWDLPKSSSREWNYMHGKYMWTNPDTGNYEPHPQQYAKGGPTLGMLRAGLGRTGRFAHLFQKQHLEAHNNPFMDPGISPTANVAQFQTQFGGAGEGLFGDISNWFRVRNDRGFAKGGPIYGSSDISMLSGLLSPDQKLHTQNVSSIANSIFGAMGKTKLNKEALNQAINLHDIAKDVDPKNHGAFASRFLKQTGIMKGSPNEKLVSFLVGKHQGTNMPKISKFGKKNQNQLKGLIPIMRIADTLSRGKFDQLPIEFGKSGKMSLTNKDLGLSAKRMKRLQTSINAYNKNAKGFEDGGDPWVDFAKRVAKEKFEHLMFTAPALKNPLYHTDNLPSQVSLTPEMQQYDHGVALHNHPNSSKNATTLSAADIMTAIGYNMKQFTAIGQNGNIASITRPQLGWRSSANLRVLSDKVQKNQLRMQLTGNKDTFFDDLTASQNELLEKYGMGKNLITTGKLKGFDEGGPMSRRDALKFYTGPGYDYITSYLANPKRFQKTYGQDFDLSEILNVIQRLDYETSSPLNEPHSELFSGLNERKSKMYFSGIGKKGNVTFPSFMSFTPSLDIAKGFADTDDILKIVNTEDLFGTRVGPKESFQVLNEYERILPRGFRVRPVDEPYRQMIRGSREAYEYTIHPVEHFAKGGYTEGTVNYVRNLVSPLFGRNSDNFKGLGRGFLFDGNDLRMMNLKKSQNKFDKMMGKPKEGYEDRVGELMAGRHSLLKTILPQKKYGFEWGKFRAGYYDDGFLRMGFHKGQNKDMTFETPNRLYIPNRMGRNLGDYLSRFNIPSLTKQRYDKSTAIANIYKKHRANYNFRVGKRGVWTLNNTPESGFLQDIANKAHASVRALGFDNFSRLKHLSFNKEFDYGYGVYDPAERSAGVNLAPTLSGGIYDDVDRKSGRLMQTIKHEMIHGALQAYQGDPDHPLNYRNIMEKYPKTFAEVRRGLPNLGHGTRKSKNRWMQEFMANFGAAYEPGMNANQFRAALIKNGTIRPTGLGGMSVSQMRASNAGMALFAHLIGQKVRKFEDGGPEFTHILPKQKDDATMALVNKLFENRDPDNRDYGNYFLNGIIEGMSPHHRFIAHKDGVPMAAVSMMLGQGRSAFIEHTGTGKNFRGKGLAKSLYQMAESVAKEAGKSDVRLEAATDSAAAFWKKMGFSVYGAGALPKMRKKLESGGFTSNHIAVSGYEGLLNYWGPSEEILNNAGRIGSPGGEMVLPHELAGIGYINTTGIRTLPGSYADGRRDNYILDAVKANIKGVLNRGAMSYLNANGGSIRAFSQGGQNPPQPTNIIGKNRRIRQNKITRLRNRGPAYLGGDTDYSDNPNMKNSPLLHPQYIKNADGSMREVNAQYRFNPNAVYTKSQRNVLASSMYRAGMDKMAEYNPIFRSPENFYRGALSGTKYRDVFGGKNAAGFQEMGIHGIVKNNPEFQRLLGPNAAKAFTDVLHGNPLEFMMANIKKHFDSGMLKQLKSGGASQRTLDDYSEIVTRLQAAQNALRGFMAELAHVPDGMMRVTGNMKREEQRWNDLKDQFFATKRGQAIKQSYNTWGNDPHFRISSDLQYAQYRHFNDDSYEATRDRAGEGYREGKINWAPVRRARLWWNNRSFAGSADPFRQAFFNEGTNTQHVMSGSTRFDTSAQVSYDDQVAAMLDPQRKQDLINENFKQVRTNLALKHGEARQQMEDFSVQELGRFGVNAREAAGLVNVEFKDKWVTDANGFIHATTEMEVSVKAFEERLKNLGMSSEDIDTFFTKYKVRADEIANAAGSKTGMDMNKGTQQVDKGGMWSTNAMKVSKFSKDLSWRSASISMSSMGVYFSLMGVFTQLSGALSTVMSSLSDLNSMFKNVGYVQAFGNGIEQVQKIMGTTAVDGKSSVTTYKDLEDAWKNAQYAQASFGLAMSSLSANIFKDRAFVDSLVDSITELFSALNKSGAAESFKKLIDVGAKSLPSVIEGIKSVVDVLGTIATDYPWMIEWAVRLAAITMLIQPLTSGISLLLGLVASGAETYALFAGIYRGISAVNTALASSLLYIGAAIVAVQALAMAYEFLTGKEARVGGISLKATDWIMGKGMSSGGVPAYALGTHDVSTGGTIPVPKDNVLDNQWGITASGKIFRFDEHEAIINATAAQKYPGLINAMNSNTLGFSDGTSDVSNGFLTPTGAVVKEFNASTNTQKTVDTIKAGNKSTEKTASILDGADAGDGLYVYVKNADGLWGVQAKEGSNGFFDIGSPYLGGLLPGFKPKFDFDFGRKPKSPGDEKKPDEKKPDETKTPDEKKPGEKKPGEKKPGEKKPGEKKPDEKKPGDTETKHKSMWDRAKEAAENFKHRMGFDQPKSPVTTDLDTKSFSQYDIPKEAYDANWEDPEKTKGQKVSDFAKGVLKDVTTIKEGKAGFGKSVVVNAAKEAPALGFGDVLLALRGAASGNPEELAGAGLTIGTMGAMYGAGVGGLKYFEEFGKHATTQKAAGSILKYGTKALAAVDYAAVPLFAMEGGDAYKRWKEGKVSEEELMNEETGFSPLTAGLGSYGTGKFIDSMKKYRGMSDDQIKNALQTTELAGNFSPMGMIWNSGKGAREAVSNLTLNPAASWLEGVSKDHPVTKGFFEALGTGDTGELGNMGIGMVSSMVRALDNFSRLSAGEITTGTATSVGGTMFGVTELMKNIYSFLTENPSSTIMPEALLNVPENADGFNKSLKEATPAIDEFSKTIEEFNNRTSVSAIPPANGGEWNYIGKGNKIEKPKEEEKAKPELPKPVNGKINIDPNAENPYPKKKSDKVNWFVGGNGAYRVDENGEIVYKNDTNGNKAAQVRQNVKPLAILGLGKTTTESYFDKNGNIVEVPSAGADRYYQGLAYKESKALNDANAKYKGPEVVAGTPYLSTGGIKPGTSTYDKEHVQQVVVEYNKAKEENQKQLDKTMENVKIVTNTTPVVNTTPIANTTAVENPVSNLTGMDKLIEDRNKALEQLDQYNQAKELLAANETANITIRKGASSEEAIRKIIGNDATYTIGDGSRVSITHPPITPPTNIVETPEVPSTTEVINKSLSKPTITIPPTTDPNKAIKELLGNNATYTIGNVSTETPEVNTINKSVTSPPVPVPSVTMGPYADKTYFDKYSPYIYSVIKNKSFQKYIDPTATVSLDKDPWDIEWAKENHSAALYNPAKNRIYADDYGIRNPELAMAHESMHKFVQPNLLKNLSPETIEALTKYGYQSDVGAFNGMGDSYLKLYKGNINSDGFVKEYLANAGANYHVFGQGKSVSQEVLAQYPGLNLIDTDKYYNMVESGVTYRNLLGIGGITQEDLKTSDLAPLQAPSTITAQQVTISAPVVNDGSSTKVEPSLIAETPQQMEITISVNGSDKNEIANQVLEQIIKQMPDILKQYGNRSIY